MIEYTDLLKLKAHLGRQTSTAHLGLRAPTTIHDPEEILKTCRRSLQLLAHIRRRQGRIFFVNTNPKAAELVRQTALQIDQSYVNQAWTGGSLTNWKQISHSLTGFHSVHSRFSEILRTHSLPKYEHARKKFEGIQSPHTPLGSEMKPEANLPDFLLLICRSLQEQELLRQEAKIQKIPVLCFVDDLSQNSPASQPLEYLLPGNTESLDFLYFYLNLLVISWKNSGQEKAEESPKDPKAMVS